MPGPRVSCDPAPDRVGTDEAPATAAPLTGAVRVGRAAVLGGLSLLLATGAHLLGGGSLPRVGVLLVAAMLLGLLAAVVTARRCRLAPLTLLLAGQQLVLHELFGVAGAARACTSPSTGMTHAPATADVASCVSAGGMQMTTTVPGWAMWAAHAAAVLATAWMLARGEAWLWRVVERVVVAAGLGATGRELPRRRDPQVRAAADPSRSRRVWRPAAPRGPPHALVV